MNPEKRELRIEPIQHKEKKAFCQGAHVLGVVLSFRQKISNVRQKMSNASLSELRNLRTVELGGSAVRTGRNESRFVLPEVKFQWRLSSEHVTQVVNLTPTGSESTNSGRTFFDSI